MSIRFPLWTPAIPALILSMQPLRAAGEWETNFENAKAAAIKSKKDLFVCFTRSGGWPLSAKLKEEVLDKEEFKRTAQKGYVLVEVDFPMEPKQGQEELMKQNERLEADYRVDTFPTVVFTDGMGRPYGVMGYESGGPTAFLKSMEEMRKSRLDRDAALKKASTAAGPEKAVLTLKALESLAPPIIYRFYSQEIDAAVAADKDDASGIRKSREEFLTEAEFRGKLDKLNESLAVLHDQQKYKEFNAAVDKFIADEKLTGQRKQEVMLAQLQTCQTAEGLQEAGKIMDAIIAEDPKSELAAQAQIIVDDLKKTIREDEELKKRAAEEAAKAGKKGAEAAPPHAPGKGKAK